MNGTNHTESPELFLRWLQFAAFAPIFRTHCRFCEQRIWTFGKQWFPLMKATMMERHRLFPYINTHAQLHTYQKGRSLLVPIYWSSQKAASMDEAYDAKYTNTQYLFGMHFLVAPITMPLDTTASKDIWLPPGEWANWQNSSEVYQGPKKLSLDNLGLEDTPVFVNTSASYLPKRISSTMKQRKAIVGHFLRPIRSSGWYWLTAVLQLRMANFSRTMEFRWTIAKWPTVVACTRR